MIMMVMMMMVMMIVVMMMMIDLEREVWRTAVLHFGLESIDGLNEVGSET